MRAPSRGGRPAGGRRGHALSTPPWVATCGCHPQHVGGPGLATCAFSHRARSTVRSTVRSNSQPSIGGTSNSISLVSSRSCTKWKTASPSPANGLSEVAGRHPFFPHAGLQLPFQSAPIRSASWAGRRRYPCGRLGASRPQTSRPDLVQTTPIRRRRLRSVHRAFKDKTKRRQLERTHRARRGNTAVRRRLVLSAWSWPVCHVPVHIAHRARARPWCCC